MPDPSGRGRGGPARQHRKVHHHAVLDAEQLALDAARTPVAVTAPAAVLEHVLAEHETSEGWSLNAGQRALAGHLVGAGTLLAAGVGPAGTGKTASMKIVADTWHSTGRNIIGLAPSAAAAAILSEDIGADCHTIDSLTFTWLGRNPNQPGRTLAALPVAISPGDMLLVDEAGMASTENLAALTEIAAESGAVLRLVGDPKQLSAVETGGLLADLTRTPGTPELREVMRMGSDTDQAEATLGLRDGNPDALALYTDRGWLTGGHREQMLTDAAHAFLADTAAGRRCLVIASTNTDVDTLNDLIRADRISTGLVDDTHTIRVSRAMPSVSGTPSSPAPTPPSTPTTTAPLGRVINGQLFTVTGITDDGALAVRDQNTGDDMLIPASYAHTNIHLGYASTIHRAQGATVDTTHAVIDNTVDRAGLYVAMTRGKRKPRLHGVRALLDLGAEDAHMHSAGDQNAPTPTQVLTGVLGRDTRNTSAIDTLRQEYTTATAPERLEQLYRHGAELAAQTFTANTLPDYLDALPRTHTHQLEADPAALADLEHAWTEAAQAGLDPRELWLEATDNLDTAKSAGAVIAHRIRHVTREHGEPDALPTPPPETTTGDTELATWLTTTREKLTRTTPDGTSARRRRLRRLLPRTPRRRTRAWTGRRDPGCFFGLGADDRTGHLPRPVVTCLVSQGQPPMVVSGSGGSPLMGCEQHVGGRQRGPSRGNKFPPTTGIVLPVPLLRGHRRAPCCCLYRGAGTGGAIGQCDIDRVDVLGLIRGGKHAPLGQRIGALADSGW